MGKGNKAVPRRKRMKREQRLQNARSTKWIEKHTGRDLVQGYRRWYGLDALTAVIDLRRLGVSGLEKREAQIRKEIDLRAKANAARKNKRELEELPSESNETFASIEGYTSNGVPYGILREEV